MSRFLLFPERSPFTRRKSAKIWLVIAILLCACVTVLNFTEGRIPSVILALAEIAALVILLVKEKKAGFWLLCGCYLLSFLTGVIGGITGGTGILLSVGASAIGSVLIPGITWLFLRKDLPNMR